MLHDVNQQVVNSVTSAGRTSWRGVQIEIARRCGGGRGDSDDVTCTEKCIKKCKNTEINTFLGITRGKCNEKIQLNI